ncbi:LOW QUALITY PROTEIN: cytochrome P450 2F5-like [Rhynchonycteris naso]
MGFIEPGSDGVELAPSHGQRWPGRPYLERGLPRDVQKRLFRCQAPLVLSLHLTLLLSNLRLINFAPGALKEFGLGMRTREERFLDEAVCLLGEFQATIGAPFHPHPRRLLDNAVSSVICSMVSGDRCIYKDPEFLKLLDLNDNLYFLCFKWGKLRGPALIPPHQPNLCQIPNEQKDPDHFQEETFVVTTNDLFFGHTETMRTNLGYGLLILFNFPEVACLPPGEPKLSKLEFGDVRPLGLSRSLTCDAHLCSHFLPKGTFITPLLVSAHQGPTFFNPTTFWTRSSSFMPFVPGLGMAGKRLACARFGVLTLNLCIPNRRWFGCRPGPEIFFTTILQWFYLRLVGSAPTQTSPTCAGLGSIPSAFRFHLAAHWGQA